MHWEIISPNTSKQTSKQHKKTKMKYPQEGWGWRSHDGMLT
jgi:hypothetical protein